MKREGRGLSHRNVFELFGCEFSHIPRLNFSARSVRPSHLQPGGGLPPAGKGQDPEQEPY